MPLVTDVLLPLDGSQTALRGLGVARWLAERFAARLCVVSAGEERSEAEALARLGISPTLRQGVELRQAHGEAAGAILAALARCHAGLVVMTAHGASSGGEAAPLLGHVTRQVIERSDRPVLVLPEAYEESLPWRSAFVPLSGELSTDPSLALALRLARALELRVSVAHITEVAGGESRPPGGGAVAAGYVDAMHHELPQRLDELIAGACAGCTAEERRRIDAVHLAWGGTGQQLLRLIEEHGASLLVAGWHGELEAGRAPILKTLLRRLRCPVLLVKPRPPEGFRLKVAEWFE